MAASERDKLRILLDHWISHNQGHVEECRQWLGRVPDLDDDAVSAINEAIAAFEQASRHLGRALDILGGLPEGYEPHHH